MSDTTDVAVVLLSGGQDSTTCLFWALHRWRHVHCLSIEYGQRHAVEVEAAEAVLAMASQTYPNVDLLHLRIPVGSILVSTSPLVSPEPVGQYDSAEELPGGIEPTFVPMRNVLFLTLAANQAAAIGAAHIVTGVCEEDYGGYPDCRRVFVDAMGEATRLALYGVVPTPIHIHTPLMNLTKRQTVELAVGLPGCMEALGYSHTCYQGESPPCGRCHACILRARGFEEAGVPDPLVERLAAK